jgi:hypothetical protein
MSEQEVDQVQVYSFARPKYVFNIGDGALVVTTYRWPNRFHRFMQRWVLGIKWKENT